MDFKFSGSDGDSGCQSQQAEILSCMNKMNSRSSGATATATSAKENSNRNGKSDQGASTECYLPAISAWNECLARKVGYL
mmetsp:Transcript_9309/g.11682  ORF Transcript_9309/g.11682 Transcript_9309/m.11682 type:complete len:80 (+) Transcript_9309:126-365(+)|eukprot:CAMPEP_0203729488 /NCGR_PEP_ID=MMETSP0092-20131115/16959_1 /ASSEMBLY_ACC=CAM_ASM_001090 /TAXON_ID=426623 /ORGANISM="Chaetoceros affinis, Strain CCMP159" /LENGTH=79 /DNA_ID=CAMNT_0050611915 /DNA_START=109 /DNA_END=348 /DNA_ORIENTATION=+